MYQRGCFMYFRSLTKSLPSKKNVLFMYNFRPCVSWVSCFKSFSASIGFAHNVFFEYIFYQDHNDLKNMKKYCQKPVSLPHKLSVCGRLKYENITLRMIEKEKQVIQAETPFLSKVTALMLLFIERCFKPFFLFALLTANHTLILTLQIVCSFLHLCR